jgi:hypothetical protein
MIADWFVDCETPLTACAGAIGWIACPSAVAGERIGIGVEFDGALELGVEFTACPNTVSGKNSKPSLVVNTVKRTICLYLLRLELRLTRSFWNSNGSAHWL